MTTNRWTTMLNALLVLVLVHAATTAPAQGDDKDKDKESNSKKVSAKTKAKAKDKGAKDLTDAEAEIMALAFVRENHPELNALLAQLKAMKPGEYFRAVRELAQVSRSLAEIKLNNPRRYEPGLEVWKARSRVDLIAARLAGAPVSGSDTERKDQLRQAVEALVDAEIHQQRVEKEIVQERLRRLEKTLDNLESRHDSVVENRFQTLLKKSQRARRKSVADANPGDHSAVYSNPNNTDADRGSASPKKGERQP